MESVKTKVYNILKGVQGIENLSPTHPRDFTKLPTVVFTTTGTAVTLDLDNQIIGQPADVLIDVWAEEPLTAETLGHEIEDHMRVELWQCTFMQEVPNLDKTLSHYVMRFRNIL